MARLKEMYQNEIVEAMIKKFGYKNIMEVPKLDKIVINMGVGEAKDNAKVLDSAVRDLEIITGQKAVLTKAKKSVANFKLSKAVALLASANLLALGIDLMTGSCGSAALGADKLNLVSVECALSLDKAAGLTHLAGLNVLCNDVNAFNDNFAF